MLKNFFVASFVMLLSFLLSSCSLNSGLGVPANQQFVLGGGQKGSFKVKYINTGDQVLVLKEIDLEGAEMQSLKVRPGENGVLYFQKGSKALVMNPNESEGNLKAKITGDLKLGMSYEDMTKN